MASVFADKAANWLCFPDNSSLNSSSSLCNLAIFLDDFPPAMVWRSFVALDISLVMF